ncbi:MAG TPA: patatin [Candidatus Thioglobus sp.]|jgi:patatin-like phospholipase/acyl hydrolase|nr:patatin [Candidatus Thioglobus sp.]
MKSNGNITRILSIDGGGIRGIVPAVVLTHLEEALQQLTNNPDARLVDFFDLFAGTSTGSMIVAGLLAPNKDNRPAYSAKEIVDLYFDNADTIFQDSLLQDIKSVAGLLNVKYNPEGIESVFQQHFPDTELSELLKPTLIPVYDLTRGKNYFFRQQKAKISARHNYYLKDVLRSATSAITYFPPMQISTVDSTRQRCFIDGGIFANNPALSAYAEFRYHNPELHAKDTMMFSLGTGKQGTHLDCESTQNWGALEWREPAGNLFANAVADANHYQLKAVYDSMPNYLRLDGFFSDADKSSLDNTSKDYLDCLYYLGQQIAQDNKQAIKSFAQQLIANSSPYVERGNESNLKANDDTTARPNQNSKFVQVMKKALRKLTG